MKSAYSSFAPRIMRENANRDANDNKGAEAAAASGQEPPGASLICIILFLIIHYKESSALRQRLGTSKPPKSGCWFGTFLSSLLNSTEHEGGLSLSRIEFPVPWKSPLLVRPLFHLSGPQRPGTKERETRSDRGPLLLLLLPMTMPMAYGSMS